MGLIDLNHTAVINKVLDFIDKQKEPTKIGILYNKFCKEFGDYVIGYKTFQRAIEELAEREMIKVEKIIGGTYGTTRLVSKIKI